ncbi:hypothetical protein Mapa_007056 [Marchantia paleacea]|nr:hypothetical protein Mapa_007056 [Marchantia paleacea]
MTERALHSRPWTEVQPSPLDSTTSSSPNSSQCSRVHPRCSRRKFQPRTTACSIHHRRH